MHKPAIIATDDGFAFVTASPTDAISFDAVKAIFAYKLDELTTDLVCCDVVTGAGDSEQIRTIHEELSGFDVAMKRMEALPGFDRKWRTAIILPPFATTRTLIYSRAASDTCIRKRTMTSR